MTARRLTLLLLTATVLSTAAAARAWVLELPEAARVDGLRVTLADVARGEVPAAAADLVLVARGTPGRTYTVNRRSLLRTLASHRLADDVVLRGAEACAVTVSGAPVAADRLAAALQAALQPWLPAGDPEAPPSTVALDGELPDVPVAGAWTLTLTQPGPLAPGRNAVPVQVQTEHGVTRFTAVVTCHAFGRVARARGALADGEPLTGEALAWEWRNLSQLEPGLLVGEESALGKVTTRALSAGDLLRQADVRTAPLVFQGDPVELVLGRGGVEVTLRGIARQDGAADQIISVRNELDGHLVTGRVVGPGRVAWRK
ncbi:MAG TPA: flagellar basal body P-ring formation chaperone FlgA [Candidatus Krumholzibacteria bacterium]|nr:flagellar basal body P-ring formation chaperone FlgA [Candidatus Krumholzibacteria bacterium]